jgi:hypothetical protein
MKQIRVHGFSDDIICVHGDFGDPQYASAGRPIQHLDWDIFASYAGKLLLSAQHSELVIHCLYDGCWSFACSQGDAKEIDAYRFKIRHQWGEDAEYSDTLIIDCPDDTTIAWEGAD